MTRGLHFVFIFLIVGYAAAQSCTLNLNLAEDRYDQGHLLKIESLISGCLGNGSFTAGEEIRARKLLTKVAIFTDNEPKAEEELVYLLQTDPVHRLQPEDPSEIRVLMNKFRTWPVYRLEFYIGSNLSVVSRAQNFSVFTQDASEKDYGDQIAIGMEGGVRISKHLRNFMKGFEVAAGVEARTSNYSVRTTRENSIYETNLTNTQFTMRLPLLARYSFNYSIDGNFIPYVFLGGSLDYLVSAKYADANRSGGTSYTLGAKDSDIKSFGQVNEIGATLTGGFGFKFGGEQKGNFFFLEARFDKSLFLYNVPDERYSNDRVLGDLMFVEDDVYLNFLSIQFGFIKSVFKPEKLTK